MSPRTNAAASSAGAAAGSDAAVHSAAAADRAGSRRTQEPDSTSTRPSAVRLTAVAPSGWLEMSSPKRCSVVYWAEIAACKPLRRGPGRLFSVSTAPLACCEEMCDAWRFTVIGGVCER